MRLLVTFLVFTVALSALALVAIAVMLSVAAGKPSWLLITIFALDSVAVVALAGHALLTWARPSSSPAARASTPRSRGSAGQAG